jgi:hypothetical protein
MTDAEVREWWIEMRDRTVNRFRAEKQPQATLQYLSAEYAKLSPAQRNVVNDILSDWMTSDDESKRFEARVLAKEHRIIALLSALRRLESQLQHSDSHSAPFELRRVRSVIQALD